MGTKEGEIIAPRARSAQNKGRLRRWLGANAPPLLSLVFIAGTTTAAFVLANGGMDGPGMLYKQGIVGMERMTLDEKMIAWKYRLTQSGRCPAKSDYDRVMGEMQDEMFRYMRLGDSESEQRVWHAMQTFMAVRISSMNDGDCLKKNGGKNKAE